MAIEDIIRIRNDVTDTAPLQGIGGSASGDVSVSGGGTSGTDTAVTVQWAADDEPMSDAAWTAQSTKIEKQSAVLADMKAVYGAKYNDLPKNFSVSSFLKSKFCEWVIGGLYDLILDYIPGNADDFIAKEVLQFGAKLMGYGIEVLKRFYNAGQGICDAMTAENMDLFEWENTRSNYELRNQVCNSHEMSMQSLSLIIAHAESQVKHDTNEGFGDLKKAIDDMNDTLEEHLGQGSLISGIYDYRLGDLPEIVDKLREQMGEQHMSETETFDEIVQALHDLAYQEDTVDYPSGVRMTPGGKIIEYSG